MQCQLLPVEWRLCCIPAEPNFRMRHLHCTQCLLILPVWNVPVTKHLCSQHCHRQLCQLLNQCLHDYVRWLQQWILPDWKWLCSQSHINQHRQLSSPKSSSRPLPHLSSRLPVDKRQFGLSSSCVKLFDLLHFNFPNPDIAMLALQQRILLVFIRDQCHLHLWVCFELSNLLGQSKCMHCLQQRVLFEQRSMHCPCQHCKLCRIRWS
jgi:hypothetical protein